MDRRQQALITKREKRAWRAQRLARVVNRLAGLQLALDQQTGKMEPVEEQERTVLEVAQTVKAAQELRRCSRETDR